jgi:hypothetical protein
VIISDEVKTILKNGIEQKDAEFKEEVLRTARCYGYVVKNAYPFCYSFYVELANGQELVAGHWEFEDTLYRTFGWNLYKLPWSES